MDDTIAVLQVIEALLIDSPVMNATTACKLAVCAGFFAPEQLRFELSELVVLLDELSAPGCSKSLLSCRAIRMISEIQLNYTLAVSESDLSLIDSLAAGHKRSI